MKAVAVFPGPQEVKVVEQEFPRLALPDQVTLRMLDIGICGTDKEICSFEDGTPPPGDDHLVIGHESLAEVVEVGTAVERLAPGDLVVPSVRRPCPHPGCLACRSGHQDYCYTGDFSERGIKEAHGYMAEYVVDHERYMNVVPPHLRDIAVLAEPLTIAEKALAQIAWMMQLRPPWIDPETPSEERGQGLSALVLGIGPVGLLGAMVLVTAGFTTYVYSRELPPSPRIDLVESIGATYVSSQSATFGQLAEQIGNIDLIYEAVGHSHFALQALKVLGTNGIFVLTGVPGLQAFVETDPAHQMRGDGPEEPGAAGHGERRAGRLRIRAPRSRPLPPPLAGRGADTHCRPLPARAGAGPDPGPADRHQERHRFLTECRDQI
jgi:threonine dehydrogenase-like Zn-dependent dehydrogenase